MGPVYEEKGHEVKFHVIGWAGRNTHRPRLAAANEIRERVKPPVEETHHFLVAHGHGGNACMLALKDQKWKSGLSGIACLATPFLVLSKAGCSTPRGSRGGSFVGFGGG